MALNPPITQTGVPLRVDQEFFILYRNEMEGEFKIENIGKFSARGKVYVTTCRIVFVSDKFQKDSFKSFDIPLAYLSAEKFQQPIFGSNYLEGNVDPLYNLLPGKTHFKLWFKAGGCDKFLKILVSVLTQIRRQRSSGQRVPDARMMENFARSQSQAYIDPNDPSIIYVQQPHLNQQSYGNTTWGIPQNPTQVSPIGGPNYGMPQQQYQQSPINTQYQQPPQNNQQFSQMPQQNVQNGPQMGIPVNYNNGYQEYPQLNNNQPQPQIQQPNQNNNQVPNPYVHQNQTYNQPINPYLQANQQQQYQQPQQTYEQPQQQAYQNQVPLNQNLQYPPPQQDQNPYVQVPAQNNDQVPQNQQQPDQVRNQPNTAYYFGFWGPQLQSNQNAVL
ncbi:unnamed protein product [Paramecium sonneborni]|uniref:Uncharacterized protein n=1 Tax=Paramecium sonneborni TaxID=65129 RepID=A0A8S1RHP8_9CILI|nr:unnamed protein product [Paramecium sonneborni]